MKACIMFFIFIFDTFIKFDANSTILTVGIVCDIGVSLNNFRGSWIRSLIAMNI